MSEPFAREARAAVARAAREAEGAPGPLTALALSTGAVTVALVASRILARAPAASGGWVGVALVTGAALALLLAVPVWRLRARRRARPAPTPTSARCPRCAAPLLAHGPTVAARRTCGRCAAALLEAAGLFVVDAPERAIRRARWQAAARARVRRGRAAPVLGPTRALAASLVAIAAVTASAHALGVVPDPIAHLELAEDEDRAAGRPGIARALVDAPSLGTPTRAYAPRIVGTQVLARSGAGPWHQLAVIVAIRARSAHCVFADGDVAWVADDGLLEPELGPGDAVRVVDGEGRASDGTVTARVGAAIRVDARWTSAARVRVRADAPHPARDGPAREVAANGWVELRDGAAGWRPGVVAERDGLRALVLLDRGDAHWVEQAVLRPQAIGPGVRVEADDRPGAYVVAARVGDALVLVDARGGRRWASLAEVRRR
ncbi:MAG: hypothetical protein KF729_28755 [Sandaracinaceae bacterium]|nr:hypothetical protein [Sandaracinaceae bacterium]